MRKNGKTIILKLLRAALSPINFISKRAYKFAAYLHDSLDPVIYPVSCKYGTINILADTPVLSMRAASFHTKEPETLDWVDSFEKGDVLYDVGANIGLYSLYAAKKGHKVLAFEPESQNYAELNKNIYLNDLSEKIIAYNIGLNNETLFNHLNLSVFKKGGACHTATKSIDYAHESFEPAYKQGLFLSSLDDLVSKFKLVPPNHLKIDVDGLEAEIIEGALETLKDPCLKSILIEANESCPADVKLIETIKSFGFNLESRVPADISGSDRFSSLYNFIFRRV